MKDGKQMDSGASCDRPSCCIRRDQRRTDTRVIAAAPLWLRSEVEDFSIVNRLCVVRSVRLFALARHQQFPKLQGAFGVGLAGTA